MSEFLINSAIFGTVLSLLAYYIGTALKDKYKLAIFNPLVIGALICIVFLKITGTSYDTYYSSAQYLGWFLTPATVCFAIRLYEQLQKLKENFKAIAIGITSGVLSSAIFIFILALVFNLNHEQYATLLPKSVTSPIGMVIGWYSLNYRSCNRSVRSGRKCDWRTTSKATQSYQSYRKGPCTRLFRSCIGYSKSYGNGRSRRCYS